MQNPFTAATRKVFGERGQKPLRELSDFDPMVDYKAAYQGRIAARRKRQADRDEEKGRSVVVPGSARAADRDRQRRAATRVRKGQRAFDRKMARQEQNKITAENMARALAGEFGPQMQANVQVVADREAKRLKAEAAS